MTVLQPSFIDCIFSHRGISLFLLPDLQNMFALIVSGIVTTLLAVINRSAKAVHFCLITLHP